MKKESIKYIFLESFFVVLGVVLAYSFNLYREHNIKVEQSEQAIHAIYDEVNVNKEILNKSINYHKYLIDTLATYMQSNQVPNISVFKEGFLYREIFLTYSWDIANSTNSLFSVDYSKMLNLSELYNSISTYNNQRENISNLIYKTMFNEGRSGMIKNYKNWYGIIRSLNFVELELQEKFKKIKMEN